MPSKADKCLSIQVTRFYMQVVGVWTAETKREQFLLNAALAYTIGAVTFALWVEGTDLYYSWGDFTAIAYNLCMTGPLLVIVFKGAVCLARRDELLELITFCDKNFWNIDYDEFGEQIMKECEKKGVVLVCILSFAVQGAISSYSILPLAHSIGKNESERVLPFRLWVNLPLYTSPYYEMIFTVQTLSAIHSGICFFCLDNLMGILNIHVVGQFRMLQHRFENLCEEYIENMNDGAGLNSTINDDYVNPKSEAIYSSIQPKLENDLVKYELQEKLTKIGEKTNATLKECVQQHLVLIRYVERLEYVFHLILLCQLGLSSVFMCLSGFQCFLAKRRSFILHLLSVFTQMLIFTWSCNEIIIHSLEIGEAAFRSRWYVLANTAAGRSLRQGLMLVMIRARRACYLSAGKFTPMSLKSFTSIISTTLSYLSLLRQMNDELQ